MIGTIVIAWGAMCQHVEFEVQTFTEHPDVPSIAIRREMKHQVGFLEQWSDIVLENTRPDASKIYKKNLSTIMRLKPIRDDLAHGTYSSELNKRDPDAIHVYNKGHKIYTHGQLEKAAHQINLCCSFFLDFGAWLSYESQKSQLDELLLQSRQ